MTSDIGDGRILLPAQITKDSVINVRALLTHPMFTGMGRDAEGNVIPPHFVNDVIVRYGGDEVAHFEWTSGISRDPYVAFPLRATREAPLEITWKDNRGGVYTRAADIRFSAS